MPRVSTKASLGNPALAAETAIATTPGISLPVGSLIDLHASVDITTGATATAVTLKLERGAVAGGAAVATYGPFPIAAATRGNFTIDGQDVFQTEQANQQYVLTVTVTAATGASAINAVYLVALFGP